MSSKYLGMECTAHGVGHFWPTPEGPWELGEFELRCIEINGKSIDEADMQPQAASTIRQNFEEAANKWAARSD